jgi:CHASE3 domain sensor protein
MYRVFVDQTTRDDIAAAAAVHRDFGPEYTDAVSEALVERIGLEIDKRVDARLAQRGQDPPRGASPPVPAPQPAWVPVAIGAGSMAAGVAATGIVLFATATNIDGRLENSIHGQQVLLVALIWVIIAVVNVAYAIRRRG